MRADIAQKWIDALLSGEYEQGENGLHLKTKDGKDKFCCLGVLCDLAVKDGVPVEITQEEYSSLVKYDNPWIEYNEERNFPPEIVTDWAGLRENNPTVEYQAIGYEGATFPEYGSLANLNDGGKTFAEIAEIIKQNVERI